jgi:hypothetical protein
MAAEAIKIRAQAAKLYKETQDSAIEGYKTMPLDDLKTHIERIQSGKGAKVAPVKAAQNGPPARQKGKTAQPAKGKAAMIPAKGKASVSTSVPAKSSTRKSSPVKGKAATGTAKRPTAATVTKGAATAIKGKTAPVKGRATAKPATGKATPAKATSKRGKVQPMGRVDIDNKAVDWKAEWGGGKTGKRAEVMSALRKFKGDKAKVFTLLQPQARSFYKGRTKHEAERLLVWLIGRVAYDFVSATAQHESGTRAEYGTASDTKNVRRRELREERRQEAEKAARAAKRKASQGAKGKAAPAKPKAQAAKGKTAPKGKGK